MITVKIREFQHKFYSLKDKAVIVVDGNTNETIGTYIPANGLNDTARQLSAAKMFINNNNPLETASGIPPVMDLPVSDNSNLQEPDNGLHNTARHACEKCGNIAELYKIWEDGDERIVCELCIRKSVPSGMLKRYLRSLERINNG